VRTNRKAAIPHLQVMFKKGGTVGIGMRAMLGAIFMVEQACRKNIRSGKWDAYRIDYVANGGGKPGMRTRR
jgi:hypothetical protein